MNCKPNDLAVVVKPFGFHHAGPGTIECRPDGLGMVVRVLRLIPSDRPGPCWEIEKPIDLWLYWKGGGRVFGVDWDGARYHRGLTLTGLDDDILRPLPSEGDVREFDERIERPAWGNSNIVECGRFFHFRAPMKEKMP